MQEEEKEKSCLEGFESKLIDLTNQLLDNFRISNIPFIVIKIFEHMEMTYFLMRAFGSYHWNYSVVGYFSMLLNFISLDQLFRNTPSLFAPILIASLVIFIVMVSLSIIVSFHSGWGKKSHYLIKFATSVLYVFLYFLKTILIIPILNIIFIALLPTLAQDYQITMGSGEMIMFGAILAILVFICQIYILVMLREPSPFSQLPYAGETILKSVLWLMFKITMVLYGLYDYTNIYPEESTVAFTAMIFLFIVYSHFQVGLYKRFHRKIQIILLYFIFIIGILQSIDINGNQVSSLTYVLPLKLLAYFLYEWMSDRQRKNIATLNVHLNQELKLFEEHIIYLIELIEQMQKKTNKILLEGYLHLHRRQCRLAEECPCYKLGLIKQRNEQSIKVQFYKLLVSLLTESHKKFPNEKKIHLFLCVIYHYRTKNYLQGIYAISKIITFSKCNILDRFYHSYYLQCIQKEMIELDEKEVNRTSDINKYLDYTNKLVLFQNKIQDCTRHHIDFWRLILDPNPQIKRLEDLGTLITRSKDQLKDQFDSIIETNSTSVHLLTIYGKFLLEVTNQQIYNVKYLEKADSILKNLKESNKIDDTGTKYSENSNTAVVVISGNQGQLGIVVHTNYQVKNLIGYKRGDLIDRNVSGIMPKIYAETHNAVLSRYIAASESTVNGKERTVPALTKDGFMLPVTALTKALPSLINGIQIVAFLAKLEEQLHQDQQSIKKCHYILYRSDTELIMGISQGCFKDFGISPNLVYGNPFNINNELKIKHIFGISFQKSQQGKVAAALEVGQVLVTLNTKQLKDQFIISKGSSKGSGESGDLQVDNSLPISNGVQVQVIVKTQVSSIYNGIPLKMLAIYVRSTTEENRSKKRTSKVVKQEQKLYLASNSRTGIMIQASVGRNDTDDLKNLKDFKNFISIKNKPSAITAISSICLVFVMIIMFAIVALIVNWVLFVRLNTNSLQLYQLTLQTEMATPQILSQTEKAIIANKNSSGITSVTDTNQTLNYIISRLKDWQLSILPYKYYFDSAYNDQSTEYRLYSTGSISTTPLLSQAIVNDYITDIQTLISANMSTLSNLASGSNINSNLYQKYASSKMNELYSIRYAYNASNTQISNWYTSLSIQKKSIVIGIHIAMMVTILLWAIMLLPYILSVTKINNRVLSLFTLIPCKDVSKLIFNCLSFLQKNLTEANVNEDDLKLYQTQPPGTTVREGSPNQSHNGSPSNFNLHSFQNTQQQMRRVSGQAFQKDLSLGVQQKFQKMINSEDRNKKIVISKFVGISILLMAFVLFYLFYSLGGVASAQTNLNNYYLLGRRSALIRNVKLLLIEFMLNPTYQQSPKLASIRTLNQNIISQFYIQEANLLYLSLGSYQSLFDSYNGGDVCSQINTFSQYVLFNETISTADCYSFNSAVLKKGLTTGVVSILEDLRSILSTYSSSVPRSVLTSKIQQYDSVVKYIQTPMLAVLNAAQNASNSLAATSQLVIILAGSLFVGIILFCWKFIWSEYLEELNVKIWRTKGLLNLIPMRIITANDLLKNQFTSGQLEKAVR